MPCARAAREDRAKCEKQKKQWWKGGKLGGRNRLLVREGSKERGGIIGEAHWKGT